MLPGGCASHEPGIGRFWALHLGGLCFDAQFVLVAHAIRPG